MKLRKEGKVSIDLDRNEVLDIYSRIQEAWVKERYPIEYWANC
jgi:hypothetical protein